MNAEPHIAESDRLLGPPIGRAWRDPFGAVAADDVRRGLVLSDDCSTDGTGAICRDYAARYPDRIRLLTGDVNVGMRANYRRTIEACRGRYVAMCDGDDWWCDPLKLQRQVEALEVMPVDTHVFRVSGAASGRTSGVRKPLLQTELTLDRTCCSTIRSRTGPPLADPPRALSCVATTRRCGECGIATWCRKWITDNLRLEDMIAACAFPAFADSDGRAACCPKASARIRLRCCASPTFRCLNDLPGMVQKIASARGATHLHALRRRRTLRTPENKKLLQRHCRRRLGLLSRWWQRTSPAMPTGQVALVFDAAGTRTVW